MLLNNIQSTQLDSYTKLLLHFDNSIPAPINYYRCEDNAGNTTVVDTMGNNNATSAVNTSVISTTGKYNNGFAVTATNYITCGTPLNNGPWTFSIWAKITNLTSGPTTSFIYNIFIARETYLTSGLRSGFQLPAIGDTSKGLFGITFNQSGGSGTAYAPFYADINTWHHYAVVYTGNTLQVFMDGKPGTRVNATYIYHSNAQRIIGSPGGTTKSECTIDNYQQWNVALTPSQAIRLYNREYGTVTDASGLYNNSAIEHIATLGGTAQLDTTQSKFGGSSLLLDGDSDYITFPDSDDWNFGSGDFTIDCWVKINTLNQNNPVIGQYQNSSNRWFFGLSISNYLFFYYASGGTVLAYYVSNTAITDNNWHHICCVRHGTNFYMFLDGVSSELTITTAISTNVLGDISSDLQCGWRNTGAVEYWFNGWIDELRVSKGIARWTSNFTPPTKQYSDRILINKVDSYIDNYTKLLLHFDGFDGVTNIPDYSPSNHGNATVAGTAQLDTAQSVFGGSSLLLDGDSDYITFPDSDDWNFGSGDFTIDYWIKHNNTEPSNTTFIAQANTDNINDYFLTRITTAKRLQFTCASSSTTLFTATVENYNKTDSYEHHAFVRNGGNFYIFLNGISQTVSISTGSLSESTSLADATGLLNIGRWVQNQQYFDGWIDELRVSKGVARWTSDFTPPTRQHDERQVIAKLNNISI